MVVSQLYFLFWSNSQFHSQKVNQQDEVIEVQGCLIMIEAFPFFQESLQQQYKLFHFYYKTHYFNCFAVYACEATIFNQILQ